MQNPQVLTAAGQGPTANCRILAVVWVGTTVAGNTATLTSLASGALVWKGQANDVNTYLGANIGMDGIPCPGGFAVGNIDNGTLLVYLRET